MPDDFVSLKLSKDDMQFFYIELSDICCDYSPKSIIGDKLKEILSVMETQFEEQTGEPIGG